MQPMRPAWSGAWRIGRSSTAWPRRFQGDGGATDGELADAALTQAAAHDDALDVLPFLQAQEAADHGGELLRELFDRAVNHARRFRVAFEQDFVELLLADLLARLFAQRVFAHLAHPFAPVIEDGLERALAGPIADEAIRRAQLGVVCVYRDAAQCLGAVGQQVRAGRLNDVVCHACRSGGSVLYANTQAGDTVPFSTVTAAGEPRDPSSVHVDSDQRR